MFTLAASRDKILALVFYCLLDVCKSALGVFVFVFSSVSSFNVYDVTLACTIPTKPGKQIKCKLAFTMLAVQYTAYS